MLVRAKEACFIDGQRRRAGAEFEYAGEVLPAHLIPVTPDVPKQEEPKGAPQPVSLGEIARADGTPTTFVDSVTVKRKK